MKRLIIAVVLAVLVTGFAVVADAADFNENSANITNKYLPFSLGKALVFAYIDKATSKPDGNYVYWHCAGYDIVDGVKCLKVNVLGRVFKTTGEYISNVQIIYWYAQSVDGSVYLLQMAQLSGGNTASAVIILGKAGAMLYMGPEAAVAQAANKSITTNTGLGTFNGCFETTTTNMGTITFAPGIGPVKQIDPIGGITELTGYEFPPRFQNGLLDINGDGKTGLEETIYTLQVVAGLQMQGVFAMASDAFSNSGAIPKKYTCNDADVSPALSWSNPPSGTKSFVLIMYDPDAIPVVGYTYDHWLIYDIPASIKALSENAGASGGANLPAGAKHGINSVPGNQYGGPCPPSGNHRYYFRLYALDIANLTPVNTNKAGIEAAISGHVLGQTEMIGTYQAGSR